MAAGLVLHLVCVPTEWSPALFIAACITWVAGAMLVLLRGGEALRMVKGHADT